MSDRVLAELKYNNKGGLKADKSAHSANTLKHCLSPLFLILPSFSTHLPDLFALPE